MTIGQFLGLPKPPISVKCWRKLSPQDENFFKATGINDVYQGFTKKRNTVRYLNHLDNDIREELKKKYTVICLFIDFEKAFDSVWKQGLMKKLTVVGVKSNVWKLINNFLFNRNVRLILNAIGIIRACRELVSHKVRHYRPYS